MKWLASRMDLFALGYLGLFVGSFITATIVPFPSDVLLISMYELDYGFIWCIAVATVANVLGGLTNYYIGFVSTAEQVMTKFKVSENHIRYWEKIFDRWGSLIGVLTWIPFIGEPLTAILGLFRVKIKALLIWMFIGRVIRYTIVSFIYLATL